MRLPYAQLAAVESLRQMMIHYWAVLRSTNEDSQFTERSEKRKAQYVQAVDIPLQLVKDERRWKEQIAELEKKLSSQSH